MPYLVRTVVGLALIVAACTALGYATSVLFGIGNCASGPQPFAIERECPEGTGTLVLALFGAFPVLGVGGALHSSRGPAPGSDRESPTTTLLLVWSGLFLGIAFGAFWSVWGPDADPGGVTGTQGSARFAAIGVGVLFVLMAIPGLAIVAGRLADREPATAAGPAVSFQRAARRPPARPRSGVVVTPGGVTTWDQIVRSAAGGGAGPAAAGGQASGDVVERLERLERLRQNGSISAAEFERLKDEIIGDRGSE